MRSETYAECFAKYLHKLFFDLILKKSKNLAKEIPKKNHVKNFLYKISIPYLGSPAYQFGCNLAKLVRRRIDINLAIHYKTAKYAFRIFN